MQTVFELDFGTETIAPKGGGRTELTLGAYKMKLTAMGIDRSQKQGSNVVGLRVKAQVVGLATGGDPVNLGLEVDKLLTLPTSADFSDQTNEGKGNRARVAELKSLFVSLGGDATAFTNAKGKIQIDASQWVGKEFVLFYEPSTGQGTYPNFHWIDPQRGALALEGKYRPKIKAMDSVDVNSASAISQAQILAATGGVTPPGVGSFAPVGATPGLGAPAGLGPVNGAPAPAANAFGSLLS